ncbi:MAG: Crp/Fnr family transcriptional regulator [Rikenellaceae bacterium]
MNNLDFNYFCASCSKSREYRAANCFTKYSVKHYKAGECIIYRGSSVNRLSILVKGSIETQLVLDSGITYTSVQHSAPYPMGALALFSAERKYRADFVTLEECTVISVAMSDIEDQMAQCRTFLRNFLKYNSSKIDLFTRHLSILTHKSLKSRLAFYLFVISKERHFRFEGTLDYVATYLNAERPSLSRILKQFVADGIISYHRGEGEILDVSALKNMLD